MRLQMQMGVFPNSYIDLSATVEVRPDDAELVPPPLRFTVPGYVFKNFNETLNPIPDLKVMGGTKGKISLSLSVDYLFYESEVGTWSGKATPDKKDGTVSCECSWDYYCSKQGELSLKYYKWSESPPSDHFSVVVGKADRALVNNPAAVYVLKMTSTSTYAGSDSGRERLPFPFPPVPVPGSSVSAPATSMKNPDLNILLVITDKIAPPSPLPTPTPIINYPIVLFTIIPFGKEGQRDLDGAARKIASDWVQSMFGLYPQLRIPIAHGDVPVYFEGYASKTGPRGEKDDQKTNDYDQQIGSDRASNVIKYLKPDHLGSKADVTYFSVGRQQAQWATRFDEKLKKTVEVVGTPRDIDRCVVVWVDYGTVMKILNKK